jgi:hypothetical protein
LHRAFFNVEQCPNHHNRLHETWLQTTLKTWLQTNRPIKCKGTKSRGEVSNCGRVLHIECANSNRCKRCYTAKVNLHNQREALKLKATDPPAENRCNFPTCSIEPGTDLAKHPCSTPACNNKVHHLCLAGSGLPLEYTESDSKDYLCYDCICKKIDALPTPIPAGSLDRLARPASVPAPSAPATTLPSAPATIPSPPAGNFYI